jgi:hypothetical protein
LRDVSQEQPVLNRKSEEKEKLDFPGCIFCFATYQAVLLVHALRLDNDKDAPFYSMVVRKVSADSVECS